MVRNGRSSSDVTRLLNDWRGGNREALDHLMPLVYTELHSLAARYLSRERRNVTLQPTALVNEAYLKLSGQRAVDWQNRAHFFGIAAQVMRRILVDRARHEHRRKRGGDVAKVQFEGIDAAAPDAGVEIADLIALDRALSQLEAMDPQQGRIVELRFFGGLTVEETAEVMQLSTGTIKRDWAVARAWLYRELAGATNAE
jgi:RNA polymerase sigma factor (TIGR02999 family)